MFESIKFFFRRIYQMDAKLIPSIIIGIIKEKEQKTQELA